MKVRRTDRLEQDGKTYDLYYHGAIVANITLEPGKEMTRDMAFAIINHMCEENGIPPRKHVDRVRFAEAEPADQ